MGALPPDNERNQKKYKNSPHHFPPQSQIEKMKLTASIGVSRALASEQTPLPAAYHLPRLLLSRTPRPRARQNAAGAIPVALPEFCFPSSTFTSRAPAAASHPHPLDT